MAIAWITKKEKRYFSMFPEVLFVDCVEDTNNEERPLCTITGRDAHGNMFYVLRAFLPNIRSWSFRWIFSYVLPNIYPLEILHRVKLVISDGDQKEYENIDVAMMKDVLKNSIRGRCGWHIVDRGWLSQGPKSTHIPNEEFIPYFKQVKFDIQNWIYSWMKPVCYTNDEFIISKALLHKYIRSPLILERLGENVVLQVEYWLRNHVHSSGKVPIL